MGKALARRVKCTILYATETGKSERYSKTLCEIFRHAFDARVSAQTPMCALDSGLQNVNCKSLSLRF